MTELELWRKHEARLKKEAFGYLLKGYEVRAALEGWFEKPQTIEGYLPDIVACRHGHYIIVEVETSATREAGTPKITALRGFVGRTRGYDLKIVIAD